MTFVPLAGPLPRPECTGTTPTVPNLTQFAPPLQCALAIGRVCCDIFRDACFIYRPVLLMLPAHCVVHAVVRLGAAWDGVVHAVVRLGAAWDCAVHAGYCHAPTRPLWSFWLINMFFVDHAKLQNKHALFRVLSGRGVTWSDLPAP